MLKSVSDVILLEDVSLLSIFKDENITKWLLIMHGKLCQAPLVGIAFSLFFLKSPDFSLIFTLLFGATSPYFFPIFCRKAGGRPGTEAFSSVVVTRLGCPLLSQCNFFVRYS